MVVSTADARGHCNFCNFFHSVFHKLLHRVAGEKGGDTRAMRLREAALCGDGAHEAMVAGRIVCHTHLSLTYALVAYLGKRA
jgi:hypothetical protein